MDRATRIQLQYSNNAKDPFEEYQNHRWEKTDNKNIKKCVRCGCTKEKVYDGKGLSYFYYERGIRFGRELPLCVDINNLNNAKNTREPVSK